MSILSGVFNIFTNTEAMRRREKGLMDMAREESRPDMRKVSLLLSLRVDINALDSEGNTMLILAARNGHMEFVQALIEKGAKLDKWNYKYSSALGQAAVRGHTEIARLLLEKKATFDERDKDGYTNLTWAVVFGHTEIARLLIEKGANIDQKAGPTTILDFAMDKNHVEIVNLLLEKGAEFEKENSYMQGGSLLTWAARRGHTETVRLLLAKGAKLIEKGSSGVENPLIDAAKQNNMEIVEMLIDAGASPDLKGKCTEDTAKRVAEIYQKKIKTVSVLPHASDLGSDIKVFPPRDRTPSKPRL